MGERRTLTVGPADNGCRLDVFLAGHLEGFSRSRIQDLIRTGAVQLSGRDARPALRLSEGERVAVDIPQDSDREAPAPAAHLPLRVLHLDHSVIVIDKPAGQVTHPALGHYEDTTVNALLARFPELTEVEPGPRPGLVHRLDRDTSGVMVVARTSGSAASLRAQFKARTVEKVYLALVKGAVSPPEGIIDAPIGRDPDHRQRMAALAQGRPAQTAYRVLGEAGAYTLVEAQPRTGRTHQIRVHFAAIAHPVAGDGVYGRRDRYIGRTALHAWRLAFDHPETGERVRYEAPIPVDIVAALDAVGIDWDPS